MGRVGRDPKVSRHLDRETVALNDPRMATAESRLRFVVNEFLRADLRRMRGAEKTATGYLLRQLTPPVGTLVQRRPQPLSAAELTDVQERLRAGLDALMQGPGGIGPTTDQTSGWHLPQGRDLRLARMSPADSKSAIFVQMFQTKSETDAIIRAVADLLVRAGRRLRICRWHKCERARIFIGERKAVYCSQECGWKDRNRRAIARRPKKRAVPP